MKFEDIGSGWLKDAAYRNSKLTKDEMRRSILKLSSFKDKLASDYVEFDLREEDGDEMIAHKKVQAVFVEGVFYIPTINYNKC